MRPEGTAGACVPVSNTACCTTRPSDCGMPARCFATKKPQKGRYRQFHQVGAEAYGMNGPDIDAELICLSARLWQRLGLREVTLQLNSLAPAPPEPATASAW